MTESQYQEYQKQFDPIECLGKYEDNLWETWNIESHSMRLYEKLNELIITVNSLLNERSKEISNRQRQRLEDTVTTFSAEESKQDIIEIFFEKVLE